MCVSYMCPYWRKGTQNFDPVLGCEGVRRVQGGEVGQSSWGICWCPVQDVTQLWRVSINCVPRHQELQIHKKKRAGENEKYVKKYST